jgi:hypothetical protein
MKSNNPIKFISWASGILVFSLAIMAFVLSYSSLQHLAQIHGVGPRLSYVWPMLLDFAMVVFSLAILRANLRQERAWYPWLLTLAFAAMATIANVLDVATLGLPPVVIAASVKALAPVSLVLSFELLMQMVRAEIRRAAVVQSLADLNRERAAVQAHKTALEADLAQAQTAFAAESAALAAKIEGLKTELAQLKQDRRQGYAEISEDTEENALALLAKDPDISGSELGRQLGRSSSLGRKLKNKLAPVLSLNGVGK